MLLAMMLASRVAHAQENATTIEVTWAAPPGCATQARVLEDVERNLGGPTRHTLRAQVDVIESDAQTWTAKLRTEVDGTPGERTLQASTCESLERATALVLALTVDPERAAHISAAPPREPQKKSTPPPSPFPLQIVVGVSGTGNTGVLPDVGIGIEGSAGVLVGPLRIEAVARDWWAQHAQSILGEGTAIHLFDLDARGCFRGRIGARLEMDPCLAGGLIFATSDGYGESTSFHRSSSWGDVGAEFLSALSIWGPLAIRGSIGVAVPITRPPFVLLEPQGEIQLHQASIVNGTGSLGIEARFP